MDMTDAALAALSDSDQLLFINLSRAHYDANSWLDYRKRLMLAALKGTPAFTLELIDEYAEAKAREILTRRALEGAFPAEVVA